MKKTLLMTVAALISLGAAAEGLDLQSRAQIRRHKLQTKLEAASPAEARQLRSVAAKASGQNLPEASRQVTTAFVTLAPGATVEDLEADGITVLRVFDDDFAAVVVPYDRAEELAASKAVKSMSLAKELQPMLDKARESTGVDAIHSGSENLPQAYTGKNVVVSVVDQGVDAHHIAFRRDDGSSRFDYLGWIRYNRTGTAIAEDHYNYSNINEFVTDNSGAYHGTHTLGILAGNYRGPVTVGDSYDPATYEPIQKTIDNPYYGVATDSHLAATCGDLADVTIAYGMDYIYQYAEWEGCPLVYSLSLGSNAGPHDPNSTMSRFFDLVASKGAIICVAAGNEGDLKIALNKTFTEEDNTLKTMIYPYGYRYDPDVEGSQTIRYGSISFYSDDDTEFDLKAVIYNKSRGYRSAMPMPVPGDGLGAYWCSSSDYKQDDTDIVGDSRFVKAFIGYVGVGKKLDEETGRYYGMIDYYVINNPETNLDDNYVLGFEITGKNGQRIDCYGDGLTTWMDSYGVEGFDDGSMNGSISDMAVSPNILVVGSYNTRDKWTCLDGQESYYLGDGYRPGYVSGFSSFGTLADGRNLPHICGPGAAIISTMSTPYAETVVNPNVAFQAKYIEENGRVNYWKQEVGTSMSTPFVAGSIALWLEADPTLTTEDVKDIAISTAVVDDQVREGDPVRWGAGKFNALAGLKEVIRRAGAGVEGITSDGHNDRLMITPSGNRSFTIFLGEATTMEARIYAMDGTLVDTIAADGDELTFDASHLESGIYVINVNGRHSEKIAVK